MTDPYRTHSTLTKSLEKYFELAEPGWHAYEDNSCSYTIGNLDNRIEGEDVVTISKSNIKQYLTLLNDEFGLSAKFYNLKDRWPLVAIDLTDKKAVQGSILKIKDRNNIIKNLYKSVENLSKAVTPEEKEAIAKTIVADVTKLSPQQQMLGTHTERLKSETALSTYRGRKS